MSILGKTTITNDDELDLLISRFTSGPSFGTAFEFSDDALFVRFLAAANISTEEFSQKYYIFDKERNIHISQSENGYVWISNMGLIAAPRLAKNNFVKACSGQKIVLEHLLKDALVLCGDESTYDIDSYNNGHIESLSHALYSGFAFYMELFSKAYLSICQVDPPHTHKLEPLLQSVKQTMCRRDQSNTLFHALVIPMLERTVNHIKTIPGKFSEAYIKYDDNLTDQTVIIFDVDLLKDMLDFITVSYDTIMDLFYGPDLYFETGLYQRLLQKCETDEDRNRIAKNYSFLQSNL